MELKKYVVALALLLAVGFVAVDSASAGPGTPPIVEAESVKPPLEIE